MSWGNDCASNAAPGIAGGLAEIILLFMENHGTAKDTIFAFSDCQARNDLFKFPFSVRTNFNIA